jgi:hypothetical protein
VNIKVIDPVITKNIISNSEIQDLINIIDANKDKLSYDPYYGRMVTTDTTIPELMEYSKKLRDKAREIFGSKTLEPTYVLFGHYFGENANLKKHKDNGFECMYNLDLCLYQNEPWDVYVEGNPYTLSPGDALSFNGVHNLHWREAFPNPETNEVGMLFFFYTEPEYIKN